LLLWLALIVFQKNTQYRAATAIKRTMPMLLAMVPVSTEVSLSKRLCGIGLVP
jgi:hypothetical protein